MPRPRPPHSLDPLEFGLTKPFPLQVSQSGSVDAAASQEEIRHAAEAGLHLHRYAAEPDDPAATDHPSEAATDPAAGSHPSPCRTTT